MGCRIRTCDLDTIGIIDVECNRDLEVEMIIGLTGNVWSNPTQSQSNLLNRGIFQDTQ